MNKTRLTILSSVALLLCVLVGGIVIANNGNTVFASLPVAQSRYPRTSSGVQGVAAITPTSHSTPAFTVADVKLYIEKTGFVGGSPVNGAHLVISKIAFVTSKQASALAQGEAIGLPDSAIVCYVELQGPFILTNMASLPPGAKVPTVQKGEEVFDATTGNLLMWGAYK